MDKIIIAQIEYDLLCDVLNNFVYDGVERKFYSKNELYNTILNNTLQSDTFILIINDKIEAIAGIGKVSQTTGQCWAFFNFKALKYKKTLFKTAKEIIMQDEHRRLQTVVNNKLDKAKKFVEHLGFKQEGIMRKFGNNGDDYCLYALLKGRK